MQSLDVAALTTFGAGHRAAFRGVFRAMAVRKVGMVTSGVGGSRQSSGGGGEIRTCRQPRRGSRSSATGSGSPTG